MAPFPESYETTVVAIRFVKATINKETSDRMGEKYLHTMNLIPLLTTYWSTLKFSFHHSLFFGKQRYLESLHFAYLSDIITKNVLICQGFICFFCSIDVLWNAMCLFPFIFLTY